jgi:hydroxyacylglutathione hydrolase
MFFRQLYDEFLAQASYVVACEQTGEALVVDPTRDVERYLELAQRHGLRICAVAETHIHADFLSGSRELARRTGATVYLSGEGGSQWSYRWRAEKTVLLHNGDAFRVGQLLVTVLHTPGHTPEHLCFAVTDRGRGATYPVGIFTGDFLLVGDVGRPDLLESAVGERGVAQAAADALFESLQVLETLPDFVQVWPGHGAGSACGKALAAILQSTVGYERRYNPALAFADREQFRKYVLSGQPDPPLYFARMKRLNRDGVPLLEGLPQPRAIALEEVLRTPELWVVDTRPWELFQRGHLPGALFAPLVRAFPTVVASYVPEGAPVVLVISQEELSEALPLLMRVGVERVVGYIPPRELEGADGVLQSVSVVEAEELLAWQRRGKVWIADVRNWDEYVRGHIPGAVHLPYARLPLVRERVPAESEVVVYCQTGERSAYAAAFLQRMGFRVHLYRGGFAEWVRLGRQVEEAEAPESEG